MSIFTRQTRRPVSRKLRTVKPRMEPLEERLGLTAGALDTSFGGDGFAQTAIGPIDDYATAALAVQSDGKTIVSTADGYGRLALVRHKTNGSLDSTFGSGGKAILSLGKTSTLADLAIQPDGKIVGVGAASFATSGGSQAYHLVVRWNSNGSIDTTFGDPGTGQKRSGTALMPSVSGDSLPQSVALQSDGRIVVGAGRSWDFAVYRYTTAGALDTTFNGTGYVTTDFGAGRMWPDYVKDVTIQPDGKIVAAGRAGTDRSQTGDDSDFGIARYNTNGTPDATFGAGGKVQLNLSDPGIDLGDAAQSVAIQPLPTGSFRIVTSGYSQTGNKTYVMTMAAVNPSGNLDPTFGTGGVVKTPSFQLSSGLSGTLSYGNSLVVQPDGRIVVGVTGRTPNLDVTVGFGLVRYTANGAIDTSFADNGISFRDKLNGKTIRLSKIALAPDGRIVVAGVIATSTAATNTNDLLFARYLP